MTDPLACIKGAVLSSVEFVHDYIQLRFDGPCLTVNAPFNIVVGGQRFQKGSPGYRDAVCERIGRTVKWAAVVLEQYVHIDFDDKSRLSISLSPGDHVGPEAAVLTDNDKVVVW